MPVPAIILAAGASRRLGQPKQLVIAGGETLLARSIRLARESGLDPIFAVLGANRTKIAAAVDMSCAHAIVNEDWEQGIASSIHAGLRSVLQYDPHAHAVIFLVCDQPRLTAEHLRALIEAGERAEGQAIVVSEYAGVAGIPAIFPAAQFANLLVLRGDSGAKHLFRSLSCSVIAIPFDGGEVDVDIPSDLASIEW